MFDAFKKLGLARAFLGHTPAPSMVDDEGELAVAQLVGGLRQDGAVPIERSLDLEFVMEHPGVTELYETRYMPDPASIRELEAYDIGTLGHEYARFLRWSGWRPVSLPPGFSFEDRALYVRTRTQMTHGLLHLITEYDMTELGELALQSFLLAQTASKQSALIVSSGFVRVLGRTPDRVGELIGLIAEAHERGRAARHYLSMAWEELWSAPIDQVRELVGLSQRASELARLNLRIPPDTPPALILGPPEPSTGASPAPRSSAAPRPSPREAPHPSREAPRPSREDLRPSREAPRPSREAPRPSREAPRPSREAPRPAREARRPSREVPREAARPSREAPRSTRPRPTATSAQPTSTRQAPAPARPERRRPPPPPRRPPPREPSPRYERRMPTPVPAPAPAPEPEPKPRLQSTEEIKNLPPGRHFIESVEPDDGYPDEDDPDFF